MTISYNVLPEAPLDPIMQAGVQWATMKQEHDDPVNTTVGVLLDPDDGSVWRPRTVKIALSRVDIDQPPEYGYQRQAGNAAFLTGMSSLVFGEALQSKLDGDVLGVQALGGTGALALANETLSVLKSHNRGSRVPLLLDDGWPNHRAIFARDFKVTAPTRSSDRAQNHHLMMEAITKAAPRSVVLLQACGYNDDGIDRSQHQWDELLELISEKDLPVIIDTAYLGLANGLEADRYAIEQSVRMGLLTFVAASASKNMGLYNERVGALFVANSRVKLGDEQHRRLGQAMDKIVRRTYSSPPLLGAKAVGLMLNSYRRVDYQRELTAAQAHLTSTREQLADTLGDDFDFVRNGRGLFTRLLPNGFSKEQQGFLRQAGILTLPNSRINIGGIAPSQIHRVGSTILEAIRQVT